VYNADAEREWDTDQKDDEPQYERDDRCLCKFSNASHESGDPSVGMNSGFVSHVENNRKVRAVPSPH